MKLKETPLELIAIAARIAVGLMLAALTSLLQFKMGNVDFSVVFPVLLGSVPGGILGAYLTNHVPAARLKLVLCAILMAVGSRLLWGVFAHAN